MHSRYADMSEIGEKFKSELSIKSLFGRAEEVGREGNEGEAWYSGGGGRGWGTVWREYKVLAKSIWN